MEQHLLQSNVQRSSSYFDIVTVLKVFSRMIEMPWIPVIDFNKVTSGIKRFGLIDKGQFDHMLLKYATFKGSYKDKLCTYLQDIFPIISITDFALVLSDVGYSDICDSILSIDNTSVSVVKKRQLPHADIVHEFYITLKRLADDNAFVGGAKSHFENMISEYVLKLSLTRSSGKRQLMTDKLVAIFFLLAKQYSDVKLRMGTFQRLRAIMPHDVDRTTFDAVFHSHMALNWAIQGDSEIADKHEEIARMSCDTCNPCLATAAMSLNSQCKNNRLFYENNEKNYLDRAYFDFDKGMQYSVNFTDEERRVWSTIATLEMSHSLLGINLYLEVCEIENISLENVERARAILNRLKEPEEVRRKMFYKLALGRLHETVDPSLAKAYVHEAIELTSEGCYKEVEKINLQNYIDRLVAKYLPKPSL